MVRLLGVTNYIRFTSEMRLRIPPAQPQAKLGFSIHVVGAIQSRHMPSSLFQIGRVGRTPWANPVIHCGLPPSRWPPADVSTSGHGTPSEWISRTESSGSMAVAAAAMSSRVWCPSQIVLLVFEKKIGIYNRQDDPLQVQM